MSNPGPAVTNTTHPQGATTATTLRLIGTIKNVTANATGNYAFQVVNSTVYLLQSLMVTNLNAAGTSVTPTGLALGVATTSGGSSLFGAITAGNLTTPQGVSLVAASSSATAPAAGRPLTSSAARRRPADDVIIEGSGFRPNVESLPTTGSNRIPLVSGVSSPACQGNIDCPMKAPMKADLPPSARVGILIANVLDHQRTPA